jgi:hypothetical protein
MGIESIMCPNCQSLINILMKFEAISVIDTVSAKEAKARIKNIPVYCKHGKLKKKAKKVYKSNPIRPVTNSDRRIIRFHDKKGWKVISPEGLAKRLGIGRMQVAGIVAYLHRGKK